MPQLKRIGYSYSLGDNRAMRSFTQISVPLEVSASSFGLSSWDFRHPSEHLKLQ